MGNRHSESKEQSQTEATTMEQQQDTHGETGATLPLKKYLTLDDINGILQQNGELIGGLEVNVPVSGYTNCYLGTIDMTVQYQTKAQTVVDGNDSLQWITRPDKTDKEAKNITNSVTDKANENGQGPNTYLTVGEQISGGSDDLRFLIVQGPPQYTFYFEDDPKDKYKIAIYTSVNKVRYYLQPSNDATNTIVASKSELPKDYPFKFPA